MHLIPKKIFFALALICYFGAFLGFSANADTYKIDLSHSTFGFAVKHVEVGITRGKFNIFYGQIHFNPDNLEEFSANIVIEAESIDTGFKQRDDHLRSADFFDVETFPRILFIARKLLKNEKGYEIVGELTMHGITNEVRAQVDIRGPVKSPFGGEVIGFSATATINRQDFGISWNNAMPDNGWIVGNDIQIIIDIEADKI